jgi:hypothetical protein
MAPPLKGGAGDFLHITTGGTVMGGNGEEFGAGAVGAVF